MKSIGKWLIRIGLTIGAIAIVGNEFTSNGIIYASLQRGEAERVTPILVGALNGKRFDAPLAGSGRSIEGLSRPDYRVIEVYQQFSKAGAAGSARYGCGYYQDGTMTAFVARYNQGAGRSYSPERIEAELRFIDDQAVRNLCISNIPRAQEVATSFVQMRIWQGAPAFRM